MKLNAVGTNSKNLKETAKFYTILGFEFPEIAGNEEHIEAITKEGSARLMIDSAEMVKEILGEAPRPGNHSSFAVEYDSPKEVDEICTNLKSAGYKIFKEPWDAVWGQRYAIVEDPDGYKVDLYASL